MFIKHILNGIANNI